MTRYEILTHYLDRLYEDRVLNCGEHQQHTVFDRTPIGAYLACEEPDIYIPVILQS